MMIPLTLFAFCFLYNAIKDTPIEEILFGIFLILLTILFMVGALFYLFD